MFDLDGTLVRTFIDFPGMAAAMRALSARHGTQTATDRHDDILEIVAAMADALGGQAGENARREAYADLAAMEEEGCAHPQPIAGATELLAALQARGVKVGIITRNCRRVAENLLARCALPCDLLIAREDTRAFKPDPEPVRLALSRLGVSPSHAAMTGDLWADVAAGQAAGVALTIGIQWPHDPPLRFTRATPDVIVESLREARPPLLSLFSFPTPEGIRRP